MTSCNWYDVSYTEKYHLVHKILAISQLNREVTMKSIIYVSIDVHKATFSACCYKAGTQSYLVKDTFEGRH